MLQGSSFTKSQIHNHKNSKYQLLHTQKCTSNIFANVKIDSLWSMQIAATTISSTNYCIFPVLKKCWLSSSPTERLTCSNCGLPSSCPAMATRLLNTWSIVVQRHYGTPLVLEIFLEPSWQATTKIALAVPQHFVKAKINCNQLPDNLPPWCANYIIG